MALTCWFCGSIGEGFRKGTMATIYLSVWEKAVPQLLPWCQTLQFILACHWYLSSCYPGSGAQREWVWVSPCMGSLRGITWNSRSFFYWLSSPCFLQPEVMGMYLPGTGILGWEACCGTGIPHSWDNASWIFIQLTWMCHQLTLSLCPSYQSG